MLLYVFPKELSVTAFIDGPCRYREHGLRRRFLASGKSVSVQLQEEGTDQESSSFVSIEEGMVLDDSNGVFGRKVDDIAFSICELVRRTTKSRK